MIVKQSPAKINLLLRVLRKREDGYHDIASLMQKISLCDEMIFLLTGDSIVVKCPDGSLPENEDNIVYKAAEALFSYTERNPGVEITINKRIPVAAGLGGGSSNAATTLTALNDLLGCGCSIRELMKIGSKIGADVPFFMFDNTAWAFGIGDRLQTADSIPFMWFVLVNPGFEVSTKKVYENLKLPLTKGVIKYNIPRLKKVPQVVEELTNDLEQVTLKNHPDLIQIKEILVKYGALGSLMSGSGPTVFGIFENREKALKAEEGIKKEIVGSVFTVHSL
jgi:4-diphosphocytidyl-2-C-methyl-D-erythritol kinase